MEQESRQDQLTYQIIRSSRKTLGIEITRDGTVLARAPKRMPVTEIDAFVRKKEPWIKKHLAAQQSILETVKKLTQDEINELTEKAKDVIPPLVNGYAKKIGVTCKKITIRCQKTRWGSCSADGNLNLNCLLMLTPPDVLEYVIVHELCHLKQMNHSALFWAEVKRVLPDYRAQKQWLTKNGPKIMAKHP